jgi:NAD(P)-dependent dehydrogenase (short-subunit alcohol dehydrogenase family)
MRIRFDGKTVEVSGAGHGFGRCIAETFAHLGARVFGCDLSAAELSETAKAAPSRTSAALQRKSCFAHQGARQRRGAMDILGPALCRVAEFLCRQRVNAPAAAVSRFEDGYSFACARQLACSHEACGAGADHHEMR